MGPKEGTPVTYYWNPIYNVMGVLPWLLLVAAFVLLRENRNLQALWILLPVVLFRVLWAGFVALVKIPSETSSMFVSLIDCLLVGFVLNWLLGERIGNRNRFVTWLLSLMVFILTFLTMLVNFGMGTATIQLSIIIGLTVGILLVSFALAGWMCRKKFGPMQFSIWLAVWILFTTIAFFSVLITIQALEMNDFPFMNLLLQMLLAAFFYAGILIVAMLPFEIVLFVSSFWRKRFDKVFQLKTKTVVFKSVWEIEPSEPKGPPAE